MPDRTGELDAARTLAAVRRDGHGGESRDADGAERRERASPGGLLLIILAVLLAAGCATDQPVSDGQELIDRLDAAAARLEFQADRFGDGIELPDEGARDF